MTTVRLPNASAEYDPQVINDIIRAIQALAALIPSYPIQTYTLTNVTAVRTLDADATTLAEVADVLGTILQDLQNAGELR